MAKQEKLGHPQKVPKQGSETSSTSRRGVGFTTPVWVGGFELYGWETRVCFSGAGGRAARGKSPSGFCCRLMNKKTKVHLFRFVKKKKKTEFRLNCQGS